MMDSVAKPEEMIEGLGRLCNCIWRLVICGGHPIDPPIDGWPAVGMPALLRPTYRCIPATNMPNPRPQVLTSPSKVSPLKLVHVTLTLKWTLTRLNLASFHLSQASSLGRLVMQAFTHKSGWHGAPVRNMPGKVLAEEREACLCCLWRHTEVMARQPPGIAQKNLEM